MTNMKTYPDYSEFLSRNAKQLPYKWKQQGTHVDIEIAGMQFEAICQGIDHEVGEDLFRLSVLFGAFANRKPMTRQQLINWLMQCLFKTWCELSNIFDSAAFITWLAQKWVDDDNVLPDNITVRSDTGVIETGVGVSAPAKALVNKTETLVNKTEALAKKTDTLAKKTETAESKSSSSATKTCAYKRAAAYGSRSHRKVEDAELSNDSTRYIDIEKSELQLKNERMCESIQSLVLQAFGLQKADLQKDVRKISNPIYRCKFVIVLLCLNANQTFEMISKYCGYSQATAYNVVNNLSKFLAMWNETDAKETMWSCLDLSDTERHNLRDVLNADILYRILKTRKLRRNLI